MKCKYCGREIQASDLYCSGCGAKNDEYIPNVEQTLNNRNDMNDMFGFQDNNSNNQFDSDGNRVNTNNINQNNDNDAKIDKEAKNMGILGLVMSLFGFTIVGLIISIIGYNKSVKSSTKSSKQLCTISLVISIICLVGYVILSGFYFFRNLFK